MSNERVIGAWSDPAYPATWKQGDGLSPLLQLPWAIAATMIGMERPPALVADVGSGPGTFLAAALARYPQARGVWIDASPAMRAEAEATLAPYDERVSYVVCDAAKISTVAEAAGADAILNSRVAHHFDRDGLVTFYRDAAGLLAPGGWLVTLDHILPPGEWDRRFRDVAPLFAGPRAGKPSHPHFFPYPSVDDHLSAFRAAGLGDVDLGWRALYTCLFLGRRP
jgi:SAM-dependent methyltransferase